MGNETANRTALLRRLGAAVGSAAAGVLLVTGCAAGQNAQTVEQTPSIDGVQAEAGTIAIRAAGIAAPTSGASYGKGSQAQLRMVIINRGAADKLVSVTSPVATGAQFTPGSSSSPGATGAGQTSGSAGDSAAVSASPSASATSPAVPASGSATPGGTASASGSSSATQNTPIELGGSQSVQIGIGSGGPSVTLTGLTTELFPSQPVPVTLTFASGASVTVVLAVQLTSQAPTAPTVSEATDTGGE